MAKIASKSFSLSNSSQKTSFFAVLMYSLYGHLRYFKVMRKYQQYDACFQTIFPFLMTLVMSISGLIFAWEVWQVKDHQSPIVSVLFTTFSDFLLLMYSLYGHLRYFKVMRKYQQYDACFQTIFPFLMTLVMSISGLIFAWEVWQVKDHQSPIVSVLFTTFSDFLRLVRLYIACCHCLKYKNLGEV